MGTVCGAPWGFNKTKAKAHPGSRPAYFNGFIEQQDADSRGNLDQCPCIMKPALGDALRLNLGDAEALSRNGLADDQHAQGDAQRAG
jgi:hypothetical protein